MGDSLAIWYTLEEFLAKESFLVEPAVIKGGNDCTNHCVTQWPMTSAEYCLSCPEPGCHRHADYEPNGGLPTLPILKFWYAYIQQIPLAVVTTTWMEGQSGHSFKAFMHIGGMQLVFSLLVWFNLRRPPLAHSNYIHMLNVPWDASSWLKDDMIYGHVHVIPDCLPGDQFNL